MANHTFSATLAVRARPHTEIYRRGLALRMISAAPAVNADVVTRNYVTGVRGTSSLSLTEITTLIATGLAPYANKTYVDSRDSLNASKSQVDSGDADRLKAATIGANNGVAGLDAAGRVAPLRVPGSSTQRWPKGFYTPASYSSATSASGTETTIFTLSVPDPGFPFRLLISGQVDCRTATDGDAPVVRVRVGSTVGPTVATGTAQSGQYRYGVDNFNRISPSLGAGWEQTYTGLGSGHTETTTKAFWVLDGNDGNRRGVFRKIADFATTVDDYQEIYYRVADTIEVGGFLGSSPRNRIYGRMNTARTSYIAFDMTGAEAVLVYAAGGSEATLSGPVSGFAQNAGDEILAQFGYYTASNKRRFRLIRNGTVVIDYTDTGSVTAMGTGNRGWGFGHQAGTSLLFGQSRPAALDWIALSDPLSSWSADPENYSSAILTGADLSSQASLVGNQTLYVTLRATSNSTVYSTGTQPKLHVMAIPA